MKYEWNNTGSFTQRSYTCGHCGARVGPHIGYSAKVVEVRGESRGVAASIYICPNCTKPTFYDFDGKQVPGVKFGNDVQGVTNSGVQQLYNEARDCTGLGAHTAAVLICRKVLMNVAVHHGAEEGESFVEYISYLADAGYVPPNGKPWVDAIRSKGNEANHEIKIMTKKEAEQILRFTEMLLRFVYEFPSMLGQPGQDSPSSTEKPDKEDGIV